jgi:hypothetical protein
MPMLPPSDPRALTPTECTLLGAVQLLHAAIADGTTTPRSERTRADASCTARLTCNNSSASLRSWPRAARPTVEPPITPLARSSGRRARKTRSPRRRRRSAAVMLPAAVAGHAAVALPDVSPASGPWMEWVPVSCCLTDSMRCCDRWLHPAPCVAAAADACLGPAACLGRPSALGQCGRKGRRHRCRRHRRRRHRYRR